MRIYFYNLSYKLIDEYSNLKMYIFYDHYLL